MQILTQFMLTPTGRGINPKSSAWSLVTLGRYIDTYIQPRNPETAENYLKIAYEIIKEIVLRDDKKNEWDLSEKCFNPFSLDKPTFLFAKVLEIKQYGDKMYLYCAYVNAGGIFKGNFFMSAEQYETIKLTGKDESSIYIIGTCIRKEYKISAKTKYDSKAHSSYVVRKATMKAKNKILTAALFIPQ